MNEGIRAHLAALNAAWQRYARTAEEQLDPVTVEGLNRDYLAAWEGLDACGVAEWMLVYDPATVTFSLPTIEQLTDDKRPALPRTTTKQGAGMNRWRDDVPHAERTQLI